VFGTVWATEARLRREKAEALRFINGVFAKLVATAEAFEAVAAAVPLNPEALRDAWYAFRSQAGAAELHGPRLDDAFSALGPSGPLVGLRITKAVESLHRIAKNAPRELLEPHNVRARDARPSLAVANDIRSSVESLKKGLRMDIS